MSDEVVQETVEQAQNRYNVAMRALETGVKEKQEYNQTETSPRNLRVGVNSAMLQQSALFRVLISKGIITEAELLSAIADAAESEVRLYEEWFAKAIDLDVKLL